MTSCEGEFVALSIADTGCGIARDTIAKIFEPFFTTKDVGKGTGLGLSQVYGFAKQSGGTVTVSSRVGQGAVFTLYLPRSHEQPQRSAPVRTGDTETVAAGSVLVVEDNTEVADIATALLNELGYQVTRVASAQTALEVLRSGEQFDLVFSDVVMPGGMNGVELAHQIGKDYPNLPVVLTTGYYNAVDKPLPRGLPVVRKPYDIAGTEEGAAVGHQQAATAKADRLRVTKLALAAVTSASVIECVLRGCRPDMLVARE